MIQLLNSILSTDICTINEKKNKIIIMSSGTTVPENYVEIDYGKDKVKIKEIHRNNEKIISETKDTNKASLLAGVLALRLFCPMERDDMVEQLRKLIKDNCLEEAHRLLDNCFSSNCYSIGEECYDKISLIQTGDTADVKYHFEYLAQSAALSRAYAVLYNYCKKKSFIEKWCAKHISSTNDSLNY